MDAILRRHPASDYAQAMSNIEEEGWGVEYRREGDDAPRATSLKLPSTLEHSPWTRAHAEEVASRMRAEGGYSLIDVVRLPYSTDRADHS